GMHVLSAQSLTNSGLFKVSIRYLQKLEFFGDIIVALGVLWRDKVSYLFHHSPGMPFEEGICHIKFYPATKSSLGMVLLSRKKDEEIKEIYSDYDLIPRYKGIKELLKDIHKFRQSGYAILKNNKNVSVAVEIGFPSYAAIGISGEISNSNLNLYINVLRNISKKIAEDISNEKS
ncbi:MAG: transcriptional regulator, partial [Verrucomicrobiota bacterium]|nr:transcriptional regulator [Verrucomicrobiota bacterium]